MYTLKCLNCLSGGSMYCHIHCAMQWQWLSIIIVMWSFVIIIYCQSSFWHFICWIQLTFFFLFPCWYKFLSPRLHCLFCMKNMQNNMFSFIFVFFENSSNTKCVLLRNQFAVPDFSFLFSVGEFLAAESERSYLAVGKSQICCWYIFFLNRHTYS